MVKPIKSKKSRKNNTKSLKKGKRLSSKLQKGGVSNACVLDYASNNVNLSGNGYSVANLHNLNPQASGDLNLDNKFMLYGGPVPLSQMGGGSKCGDEGVGSSNPKSNTFKNYITNLDKQLSFTGGYTSRNEHENENENENENERSNNNNNNNNRENRNTLKGSGYTVDPDCYIAGQPCIGGYDDQNPPALIKGKLVMSGAGAEKQVCGNGATKGGSRKSKRKSKRKSSKSKNNRRSKKKSNRNKKLQKGGDFLAIGTKPADYSTAFDGPKGIFQYPDDMSNRQFGESQPNYSVNAI